MSDGRQYLGQQIGRDGRNDAEAQLAAERVAMLLGDLHEFVRIAQHAYGLGDDGFAHRRQHHPTVAPFDQRHAEALFEFLELGRQRGLADKTRVGGASEVPMFGDGDQVLEVAQIHGRGTSRAAASNAKTCGSSAPRSRSAAASSSK